MRKIATNLETQKRNASRSLPVNTQHIFHPLTENTIIAFKSRAQAIFILLEKTPPPGLQNLYSRNFFHYSTL